MRSGPVPPGSTIGILGGGQLGRMTALAAGRLGYRCHIYAPEMESPAAEVAADWTRAGYDDAVALDRFAAAVDVVTLEFENVETAALQHLADRLLVRPGAAVLEVTQDRLLEKRRVAELGAATTGFVEIATAEDLGRALPAMAGGAILKTRRFGYDGKGQVRLAADADAPAAFAELGGAPAILEQLVDLALELSVISARAPDGTIRSFPPVQNIHERQILRRTIHPAPITPALAAAAVELAERITAGLEVVGLLAVEMFVTREGRLLVNELAPRPHNSGHWTIDGCAVSQFEQLVRAVCGLPLGDPAPLGPAVMDNLLGEEAARWPELLALPGARLHLYGKRRAAPGRKMGHVTRLVQHCQLRPWLDA